MPGAPDVKQLVAPGSAVGNPMVAAVPGGRVTFSSGAVFGASITTFSSRLSVPGLGTNSQQFGAGAVAAATSRITVIDYTQGVGDTVTVTQADGTVTVLTEGVDFTAATSNAVTAESIRTAINTISGITGSAGSGVFPGDRVDVFGDMTAVATSDPAAWTATFTVSQNNTVVGVNAEAANQSTAMGFGAIARDNGVAIGVGANAHVPGSTGDGPIAIGHGASTFPDGLGSQSGGDIAIGDNALSRRGGVAIGRNSSNIGGAAVFQTAIGNGASTTGDRATVVGRAATAGDNAVAFGGDSASVGSSVAIGASAVAVGSSIAIGRDALTTSAFQLVIGGDRPGNDIRIKEVYIGSGVTVDPALTLGGSIPNVTFHGTSAITTADKSGSSIIYASGKGTGAGAASTFTWQTPTVIASGVTPQALTTRLEILADGTVSAPGVGAFTNSEQWGAGALAQNLNTTAVGALAYTGLADKNTVVGASALIGERGTFKVLDYTQGAGDTITITHRDATVTVLTEGVDFNAVTSNGVTAANMIAAIDAVSGLMGFGDVDTARAYGDIVSVATSDALAWTAVLDLTNANTVVGFQGVAIKSSVAMGATSYAQDNSTAVGWGASAHRAGNTTAGATSIGYLASCVDGGGLALGSNSIARGSAGTAVGSGAKNLTANGFQTAVGDGATSTGDGSTALGASAVSGSNCTALGKGASASVTEDVAVGRSAVASAGGGTAVGATAVSSASLAVAVGWHTNATSTHSIAIGGDALASVGIGSIAIGNGSIASGATACVALGYNVTTLDASVAIGASATGVESVTVGLGADGSNQSVAIGRNATTPGGRGVAVGYGALASGDTGVAVGRSAEAGAGNTAVGLNSLCTGSSSATYGNASITSTFTNALAVGASSTVSAVGGSALGNGAVASASNATALGRLAVASAADSIALGRGSLASVGTGNIAIGNGAVASGTPTCIAIGRNVTALTSSVAIGGSVTGNASVTVGMVATAGTQSVAVGASATASGTQATSLGNESVASATSSTSVGRRATCTASRALALGADTDATALSAIALGQEAQATHNDSMAVGARAFTTATNQLVFGGPSAINSYFDTMHFGRGVADASPSATVSLFATDTASGTVDVSGSSWVFGSGVGTGASTASTISFETPTAISSGSVQQTRSTRLRITDSVVEVQNANYRAPARIYAGALPAFSGELDQLASVREFAFFTKSGANTFLAFRHSTVGGDATDFHTVELT